MSRIVLFLLTNLAAVLLLSLIGMLFGLDGRLGSAGLAGLAVGALVFGMSGSLVSLALSKWIAKWTTGARVIHTPQNQTESWLVARVAAHAEKAGIAMPEVAIYGSDSANAFATGMSRNHALVAVSTGLLTAMAPEEIDAVLGHEVAHVANGDMVTLALLQGVLNTFVIFGSRVVGELVDKGLFRNERGRGIGYYATVLVLELVLGLLASMVVAWHSRRREFHADYGGAQLTSRANMQAALRRLASFSPQGLPGGLAAFGIAGGGKFSQLFSTHPPLAERIKVLGSYDLP